MRLKIIESIQNMDVAKTISDKASLLMLSVFIKRGNLSQIELEKIRAWLLSNLGDVIKNWRSGSIILNLFKYGKSINILIVNS